MALAGAATAAAVGIGIAIFVLVRPRGEKLGTTSLTEPSAAFVVDGKPGDTLFFRVDASTGVALFDLVDDDQRDRQASELFRKSELTVRATSSTGVERTATCAVYKGRATSTVSAAGSFSRTGMTNDCQLPLDGPGAWTVRASVAWSPKLALRSASLEIRRESAKP